MDGQGGRPSFLGSSNPSLDGCSESEGPYPTITSPPIWTTSSEAFFGERHGLTRSLHHLSAETLHDLAHYGPSASWRFDPWKRSSATIGSFAMPSRKAALDRPEAAVSGEMGELVEPRASRAPFTPLQRNDTTDSLGSVNLAGERARRERSMATKPSHAFDPAAYRPDSAVRDHVHRPHVLLRRGLYHPM
jgi:hypothetical protein